MLNALIVTQDPRSAAVLECLAAEAGFIRVKKTVARLLQPYESVRLANSDEIDLLFVDFADPDRMPFNEEAAESLNRWTGVIGFSSARPELRCNPLPGLIQGWLPVPPTDSEFLRQIIDVTGVVRERTQEQLYALLPSKAGCGSSTIAVHVARELGTRLNQDVLLVDADLRSGVLNTMLNQHPESGLQDILRQSADLTPAIWNSMVVMTPRLHLLGSGAKPGAQPYMPHWTDYYKLLHFARRNYKSIVVDLPELVNDATAEVVRAAEHVLVVTSAELAALTLAGQRLVELDRCGVRPNRVGIVLNRWHKTDMKPEQVESMLERKVVALIPNNYRLVQAAALEGGFVGNDSSLGKAYSSLVSQLLGEQPVPVDTPHAPRRGFRALFG